MDATIEEQLLRPSGELLAWYEERIAVMSYREAGIFFGEALAFVQMCQLLKVDAIFESGIAWGQSTEIWARCFPTLPVQGVCIDGYGVLDSTRRRLHFSGLRNVTLHRGNGFELLPALIEETPGARLAVFIDGPKKEHAVRLAKLLAEKDKRVVLVGFHDVTHGHAPDEWEEHVFNTDTPEYNEACRRLDIGRVLPDYLRRYPLGPGVGLAMPNRSAARTAE